MPRTIQCAYLDKLKVLIFMSVKRDVIVKTLLPKGTNSTINKVNMPGSCLSY